MRIRPILILSWKNVWRNPLRSSVLIVSVILATWSGIFLISFFNGMTLQFVTDQLDTYTSHLQIHQTEFIDEMMPHLVIENADSIITVVKSHPSTLSLAKRSVVQGLASSATNNYGVIIYGV